MIEQKYLDKINFPSDLKKLKTTELKILKDEFEV